MMQQMHQLLSVKSEVQHTGTVCPLTLKWGPSPGSPSPMLLLAIFWLSTEETRLTK